MLFRLREIDCSARIIGRFACDIRVMESVWSLRYEVMPCQVTQRPSNLGCCEPQKDTWSSGLTSSSELYNLNVAC